MKESLANSETGKQAAFLRVVRDDLNVCHISNISILGRIQTLETLMVMSYQTSIGEIPIFNHLRFKSISNNYPNMHSRFGTQTKTNRRGQEGRPNLS